MHSKGYAKKEVRRDSLSDRHQCKRPKLKMGGIKVRVVFHGNNVPASHMSSIETAAPEKENVPFIIPACKRQDELAKKRWAEEVLARLKKVNHRLRWTTC